MLDLFAATILVLTTTATDGGTLLPAPGRLPAKLTFAWPDEVTAQVTLKRSRGPDATKREVAVFAWNTEARRIGGELVLATRAMSLVEPRGVPRPDGPFRLVESIRRVVRADGSDVERLDGLEEGMRTSGLITSGTDPGAVSAAAAAVIEEERETWAFLVGAWAGQPSEPGVEHRTVLLPSGRPLVFKVSTPGPCPKPSRRRDCVVIDFHTEERSESFPTGAGAPAIRDLRLRVEGSLVSEARTLLPHRLHYVKRAAFQVDGPQPMKAGGADEFDYSYRYVSK